VRTSHAVALIVLLGACIADRRAPLPPASPAHASYRLLEQASDLDGAAIGPLAAEQQATIAIVFASWCHPCQRQLAILEELQAERQDVRVIGINAYEEFDDRSDVERMRAYVEEHAAGLRVVRADQRLLGAYGGVPKIPSVFVYDRSGAMAHEFRRTQVEPPTRAELDRALAALAD
jgi:thiol-disulfide isomerase/thioredoxin